MRPRCASELFSCGFAITFAKKKAFRWSLLPIDSLVQQSRHQFLALLPLLSSKAATHAIRAFHKGVFQPVMTRRATSLVGDLPFVVIDNVPTRFLAPNSLYDNAKGLWLHMDGEESLLQGCVLLRILCQKTRA
jgi:hypothetical protein